MAEKKNDYQRPGRINYDCKGIDVNHPIDNLRKTGKYPYIKNVTCTVDGVIEVRAGLVSQYTAGATPGHSLRRLNDSSSGAQKWARVHGVGTEVRMELSSAPGSPDPLTGVPVFSGNPLSLTPMRPPKSPQPWMYIGDTTKMVKVRADSLTPHSIGLPAPIQKPIYVTPSSAPFLVVDMLDDIVGWVASGGGAIGPSALRVNTTVTASASQVGNTYVVRPNILDNIGVGMVLNMTIGIFPEQVMVQQVNKGSAATQISTVVYEDSGTICYIATIAPLNEAQPGSMIYNSTRGNYGYVNAVNTGVDGTKSLEVKAAFATWAANDTVSLVQSFVITTTNPFAPAGGSAITARYVPFTSAATGSSKFSKTNSVDLSRFTMNGVNLPVAADIGQPSDFGHISLLVDKPELITEIKLYLDVDRATNDFTRNYYTLSISANDLTPVIKGTQSTIDNRRTQVGRRIFDRDIQRFRTLEGDLGPSGAVNDPDGNDITSDPTPPTGGRRRAVTPGDPARRQLTAGDNQFSEITFNLNSMTRVGSDDSRSLAFTQSMRIELITTGVVIVWANSWIFRGGYTPDSTDLANPYQYAYRYRCSSTGAVSDLSPASTALVYPRRQNVYVGTLTTVSPAEIDKIDIFRIGGTLDQWCYVGTIPNAAPGSFIDNVSDEAARIIGDAVGTFDQYDPDLQPWPILDTPKSGTATIVAGTIITSAAQFNTTWAQGTLIIVGQQPSTITRVISASKMELSSNVGSGNNVPWEIPQPVKLGQPLLMFGPFKEFLFALGDKLNPGTLYWTKRKNPDSTSQKRKLELTSGSEVLQNGFVFNQRPGVFSSERLFYLDYTPLDETAEFTPHVSVGVPGLYAKYAFAVNQRRGVALLADDGVYLLGPDGVTDLTSADLQPLFPYQGKPGQNVTIAPINTGGPSITFKAPYMPNPVGAEEKYLRLCFGEDDMLYFFYRDSTAGHHCLRYDFDLKGWFPHEYGVKLLFVHSEEGPGVRSLVGWDAEASASFYTVGGDADVGMDGVLPISCEVRTPSYDFEDPRSDKQFGDIDIDIDPGGATVAVVPGFDNHVTTLAGTNLSGTGRINPPTLIDLVSGGGQLGRNISLDISWTNQSTNKPKLYLWEPSFLQRPEQSLLRNTDFEPTSEELLYVRGFWIEADTRDSLGAAQPREVGINYVDQAGVATTISITNVTHNGKQKIFYPINTPFYASAIRYGCIDSHKWRLYAITPLGDPAPDYSTEPTPWTVLNKLVYARGIWIDADTLDNDVDELLTYVDHVGTVQTFSLTMHHAGRSKIFYPFTSPIYVSNYRLQADGSSNRIHFGSEFEGEPAPPFSVEPSAWTDDGEIGNKWLQGAVIDIDTHGVPVSLEVEGDEGVVLQTFLNINAAQRSQVHINLDPTKTTHLMRVIPLGLAHIFGIKWFWQSEAELADHFEAQPQAGDLPGYKHLREVWIAYEAASSPITLTIDTDQGTIANIPQIPASASYTRKRILIPSQKFKWYKPVIDSASTFHLDRAGCEFHMKKWATNGDYEIMQPFGFPRHDRGVAID